MKRYKSCTAEIGQHCSKHGAVHRATEAKPILMIKTECKECNDNPIVKHICLSCGGKQSTTKIYPLRDFIKYKRIGKLIVSYSHKIPFKSYEIKKVSEMIWREEQFEDSILFYNATKKHDLKESDELVLRKE